MKLEQQMYETPRGENRIYTIGDLEGLSASVLYTDFLPKMGPGGFGLPKGGDPYAFKTPIFKIPQMEISTPKIGETLPGGLTIKDLTSNCAVFQEDFEGVGNIYTAHPDGGGATRFYGLGLGKKKVTKHLWEKDEDE